MKRNFTFAAIFISAVVFFSSCQTQNIASRFTSKYAKANTGKVVAQSSEAVELGYTMLALTELAQKDTNLVDHNSAYYVELMKFFGKHQNDKGVEQLNAQLTRNPEFVKNYVDGLFAFQMNNGRFGLKADYRIDLNKIDFKRYDSLLEKFYHATNFHSFYMQHQDLYAQMVQKANEQYNMASLQSTVNAKGFQVVVSPLTKATSTLTIKGSAYTEGVVFATINMHDLNAAPQQVLASKE